MRQIVAKVGRKSYHLQQVGGAFLPVVFKLCARGGYNGSYARLLLIVRQTSFAAFASEDARLLTCQNHFARLLAVHYCELTTSNQSMPFFRDSEQLYACLQALFERLRQQEAAMRPLITSRLIIRMHYLQPEAEVTVNARHNPVQVTYGPAASQPALDVELTADTFHQILLNELSVRTAIGNKQVRVNGPFIKAMMLVELFNQGQKVYPDVLRARGLI